MIGFTQLGFKFYRAAANGMLSRVEELLLDSRVDPSDYHNGPLRLGSLNGHKDIVRRLLLEPSVDPTDNDFEGRESLGMFNLKLSVGR